MVRELFECCVNLLESHFCVRAGMLGNYVLWFGIAWGKQILHFTRNLLSRVIEMQTLPVSGFGIPTILKCNFVTLILHGKQQKRWHVWGVIKCAGFVLTRGIFAAS